MTRFMLVFVSIFLSLLSRTVVAVYLGSCPYYFTENTASATQNYYSCYISACPGDTLVIGSCGSVSQSATCGGDQFLRLFDGEDYYSNEIAFDDDGCGNQCSQIIYTVPSWTICRNYFIHEGCYNNDRCGAVVEVTRLPAPSAKPTAAPSRAPTIRPSFRRTQNPTPRPSGQPSAHPSVEPTPGSTAILTLTSSKSLQPTPTNSPVSSPTVDPSLQPTSRPSTSSTSVPIALNAPSASPSAVSTETATRAPTSPVAEPIDESIAPQNDSSSDAINGGGIAGIAISCVILCAILIYAYYRCQEATSIQPAPAYAYELGQLDTQEVVLEAFVVPESDQEQSMGAEENHVVPSAPPSEPSGTSCKLCSRQFATTDGFACPKTCRTFTCWGCLERNMEGATVQGRTNEEGELLCCDSNCRCPISVIDLAHSRAPSAVLRAQQDLLVLFRSEQMVAMARQRVASQLRR